MYSAIRHPAAIAAIAVASLLAACSNTKDEQAANDLIDQAELCISQGDYTAALSLIDSLDETYPSLIDIRRKAMPVRAKAMVAHLENQLIATDDIIGRCQEEYDRLMPDFTLVESPGGSYFIHRGAYGSNLSAVTGVQARISADDGAFYIVASNTGSKIGINQVTLNGSAGSMSTLPLSDAERAGDTDKYGTDLATFATSECDSLGSWAFSRAGDITSATISGPQGSREIHFTAKQGSQFGEAWRLAKISRKLRDAILLHEKTERQILIARDHMNSAAIVDSINAADQQQKK